MSRAKILIKTMLKSSKIKRSHLEESIRLAKQEIALSIEEDDRLEKILEELDKEEN